MSDSNQKSPWELLSFEGFSTLNTNDSRPGIKDNEMAWCDGFMPLGNSKLRTMPGLGSSIFTPSGSNTVVSFDFGNIGPTPVMVVFQSDGSVWLVNTNTAAATEMAPAGTIISPAVGALGITQWGNQCILIASQQPNGYFAMDLTNFYQPGSIAPTSLATLTAGGSGYTSVPSYVVFGGSGSGVVLTPVILEGSVVALTVDNPGSGYLPGEIVQVAFSGGGTDNGAELTAGLASININYLTLVAGGSGYTTGTQPLVFTGGGGTGASGTATVSSGGVITAVDLVSGGTGYTGTPTITVAGGSGAVIVATLAQAGVAAVTVVNGGTNYTSTPTLTITGGGGTGATAVAVMSGGAISSVTVTAAGSGYTSVPAVEVETGVNKAAAAILDLMPYGISGSALETYQSRVWVTAPYSTLPQGAGGTTNFSAPESFTDFSTADGGGSFTSQDSFLRVSITQPRQTNGFLYFINDSSVNYVAGVSTSGTPPETSFSVQNADPEVGTPYASTVDVVGSNIIFANAFGVHVSYGGRVTKISDPLDGFYNTVPNFGGAQLSACKSIVYGKKIWALLVPVVDLVSQAPENKLCLWYSEGETSRWWTTDQDEAQLTYVQHQEVNSVLTAYGTDGYNIYPLFAKPSKLFAKTVKSKLWAKPNGYMVQKSNNRVWLLGQYANPYAPAITVSADNEVGGSALTLTPTATGTGATFSATVSGGSVTNLTTTNRGSGYQPGTYYVAFSGGGGSGGYGQALVSTGGFVAGTFVPSGGSGYTSAPTATLTGIPYNGIYVANPQAIGQAGYLCGITLTTEAEDLSLISVAIDAVAVGGRW